MTYDILVVDDDSNIRKIVCAGLEARSFSVHSVPSGQLAIEEARNERVRVVVLDLGLPDIDGIDVVRTIRSFSDVPIIVLSADGSDSRKVLALELGADDYVTKPFSIAELVARVRVALRHREHAITSPSSPQQLVVGRLMMNVNEHTCHIDDRLIELTPKEFAMLATLASRPGSLVTHRMLLSTVWGAEYSEENHYLRVYASNIRKKIGDGKDIPEIRVEAGVGYRLVVEPSPS